MVAESLYGVLFDVASRISVVKEFCKISLDFIKKGVNRKVYHSAARKLLYLNELWLSWPIM